MDTRIKANNVEINLRMNEEPTYLPGRGYAHIADVLSNSDRIELTIALIGLELWVKPLPNPCMDVLVSVLVISAVGFTPLPQIERPDTALNAP